MAVVTMRQMLDAGVHFGHQTRRWNPKMKRFIFTERNGIYIIDLQQTLPYIDRAYEFIKETVAHGGTVLFVGTKRQAQEAIAEQATRVSMPYVNQRWLGGMLTNFHDRAQASAAAQGPRGDGDLRRVRRPHQEGGAAAHPREGQAGQDPRRHPGHGQGPVGRVDRGHQEGAHRRRRGPQAEHPGRRGAGHQLRSGRGRLPGPGQRRRDPVRRAADQGRRRGRRRGPAGPLRRRTPAPPGEEPLAEWERELLEAHAAEASRSRIRALPRPREAAADIEAAEAALRGHRAERARGRRRGDRERRAGSRRAAGRRRRRASSRSCRASSPAPPAAALRTARETRKTADDGDYQRC